MNFEKNEKFWWKREMKKNINQWSNMINDIRSPYQHISVKNDEFGQTRDFLRYMILLRDHGGISREWHWLVHEQPYRSTTLAQLFLIYRYKKAKKPLEPSVREWRIILTMLLATLLPQLP